MNVSRPVLLSAVLFAGWPFAAAEVVGGLPRGAGNRHYVVNRAPLASNPLSKLPLGSVRAQGWLHRQLGLMAEGFTGHLDEISSFCRYDGSAWTQPDGRGTAGWEEVPYWLKGFVDLGYLLDDPHIVKEGKRWLEAVLAKQTASGYFGSRTNLDDIPFGSAERFRMIDIWPNMVMLYPLRSYYEATNDRRILEFMTRYFHWQASLPLDRFLPGSWQKFRAGDNLDSIYWLYNRTGESWLLDLARVNHERTSDWVGGIPTWHGVNLSQCFREPAMYYQQTRDRRYINATQRLYDTVMDLYGQVPGGMFAADENARPGFAGPRQGAETCSMVEMLYSHETLLQITGDPAWADRAEEIAFNSLPASMTPDLKGLHYLTAPNMVQLDRTSKAPAFDNGGDMLSYNPYQFRCCQHNVAFGWPYLVEHLWMATQNNGLAAAIYGPSRVKAQVGDGAVVEIIENTEYPFSDRIEFRLSTSKPAQFPLSLRIPAWCKQAKVSVNGERRQLPGDVTGWMSVNRTWRMGDRVVLELPMTISTRSWASNRGGISVQRGPLAYSLQIGEKWVRYGATEAWPAYEVFATSPWNYGLPVNPKFEVVAGKVLNQPFQASDPPLVLKTEARKISAWTLEPNGLIGEIQPGLALTEEPLETVRLIPMGCARLRISVFPKITTDAKRGIQWSSSAPVVTASHTSHFEPPSAVFDNRIQTSTADLSMPRFTWGDQRGTKEWIEYTFPRPRILSWTEIYWLDDTIVDGPNRLPAEWALEWWDGQAWQPVKPALAERGSDDHVDRATFRPFTTTRFRLNVELLNRQGAGIIEWRVGGN